MKLPSSSSTLEERSTRWALFQFTILSAQQATAMRHHRPEWMPRCFGGRWLHNAAAIAFLALSVFIALQLIAENKNGVFSRTLYRKNCVRCVSWLATICSAWDIFYVGIRTCYSLLFVYHSGAYVCRFCGIYGTRRNRSILGNSTRRSFCAVLLQRFILPFLYAGLLLPWLLSANCLQSKSEGNDISSFWWLLVWNFSIHGSFSAAFPAARCRGDGNKLSQRLKVFAQYIMIPLVAVYLCILYAYMGKIIFQWELAQGLGGYLVLGFSTTESFRSCLFIPLKTAGKMPGCRGVALFYVFRSSTDRTASAGRSGGVFQNTA